MSSSGSYLKSLKELYPKSVEKLKKILGDKNYESLEPYLHSYDGTDESVKPIAKYITVYWVGRASDRMILRTEGEDDIILSQIKNSAVPTIIFRKLKAIYLRRFMELVRDQWVKYRDTIINELSDKLGKEYDFLRDCSIAVGIAGEGKGVLHGRCMKCPVDILMGATSAGALYNLVSRFVGDAAYALTASTERRTGSSVDEITYTTIMITEKISEEERRTGGLFSETFVEPGTLFVGKIVLPMISPPEFLHVMWLLTRVVRVGARTSIQGTLEVQPIAVIGDLFEVGTAYELAEKLFGKKKLKDVREGVLEYLRNEVKYSTSSNVVEITENAVSELKKLEINNKELAVELWKNAVNYVKGVENYIKKGEKAVKEKSPEK